MRKFTELYAKKGKPKNRKQIETYNSQKLACVLADYHFETSRVFADGESADIIAYHFNGKDVIKIQVKGDSRFEIATKYLNKGIYIAVAFEDSFCLYDHDDAVEWADTETGFLKTESWRKGNYSCAITGKVKKFLSIHKI